jgi:hypothetical protein
MGKEQLGTLVGTFRQWFLNFCHCWESLAKAERQASLHPHYNTQENNSSILMLLLITLTHVRWHDHPKNTLCFWGLVVDMVNNNVDRNYSKFQISSSP